jgi:hypothetical protein
VLISIALLLVLIHRAVVDHKREQDRRVLCYMEGRKQSPILVSLH